jgi:hypothetical protein
LQMSDARFNWLLSRDSNPDMLIQSQLSCRGKIPSTKY